LCSLVYFPFPLPTLSPASGFPIHPSSYLPEMSNFFSRFLLSITVFCLRFSRFALLCPPSLFFPPCPFTYLTLPAPPFCAVLPFSTQLPSRPLLLIPHDSIQVLFCSPLRGTFLLLGNSWSSCLLPFMFQDPIHFPMFAVSAPSSSPPLLPLPFGFFEFTSYQAVLPNPCFAFPHLPTFHFTLRVPDNSFFFFFSSLLLCFLISLLAFFSSATVFP